jgi:nucleotide-binding universal stress UspA family protein
MKVLVGVDQSPESRMALRYVCLLLDQFDAAVDAVYVKPDVLALELEDFQVPFFKKRDHGDAIEAEADKVRKEIENACEVCFSGKVPCEPRLVVGDPAEELLNTAEKDAVDLIVLGSHGRSALQGLFMGAIHSKILHHASQPVLIVREEREIRKVLVVYRATRCDLDALNFISPLFLRRKPEITVLHVQETDLDESDDFAQACLLKGGEVLENSGHAPLRKHARGNFLEETLREIEDGDYDLVVLGAYGHEKPKALKMISDEALSIVSRTNRPVLVYRDKI